MISQFLVQIFALYKYFRKNLRKKRRKFSMDPICINVNIQAIATAHLITISLLHLIRYNHI